MYSHALVHIQYFSQLHYMFISNHFPFEILLSKWNIYWKTTPAPVGLISIKSIITFCLFYYFHYCIALWDIYGHVKYRVSLEKGKVFYMKYATFLFLHNLYSFVLRICAK